MKPKQWLHDNGYPVKPDQRGRLSREYIEAIEEAVRNGAVIEGYSVSTTAPAEKSQPAVTKTPVTNVKTIADLPDERRNEDLWQAHTLLDGKKQHVGMRTVCNNCHNSLTYCPCRVPVVWVTHEIQGVVTFTPKPRG